MWFQDFAKSLKSELELPNKPLPRQKPTAETFSDTPLPGSKYPKTIWSNVWKFILKIVSKNPQSPRSSQGSQVVSKYTVSSLFWNIKSDLTLLCALSKAKSKRFFEFTVEVYMLATAHFEFKALLLSSSKSTGHLQPHTPTHFSNKSKIEKSFRLHNERKICINIVDNFIFAWWLPDNCLMKVWWLPDNSLTTISWFWIQCFVAIKLHTLISELRC